jgi:PPM family protein phosphatase
LSGELVMRAVASGLTDVGLQREHNEDSFVVLGDYDLFIVADGMGGHRAGDIASRLATDTIAEFFRSTATEDVTWPFHFDTSLSEEENRLLTGIRIANRQIFEQSSKSRECRGMGTTVVGALFSRKSNRMYIGHVGDSRCYRVRRGELRQMTRDHSLINDYLLAMPDLTEEQRSELPKNVITRALGMQDQVMVDLQSDEPQVGDMYLLCSDGLSGMIGEDEILDILMSTTDLDEACRRLVARANEHGGEDNITAIVVRIDNSVSSGDSQSIADERTTRPTFPVPGSPVGSAQAGPAVREKATPQSAADPAQPAAAKSTEPSAETASTDVQGSVDLPPTSDR